jgi:hypothetical protein
MTKDDEAKVREIVKSIIEKQFEKESKSLDDKFLTKKQVKDLMIKAFEKQHKFAWEKSKFMTSYFNEL